MSIIQKFINIWGVPIIILALPLYLIRFRFFGIPFTLLEVLFWPVFLFWFFDNYKNLRLSLKSKFNSKFKIQNSKFSRYPFAFFIILFIVASFVGLVVAGFSSAALGIYKAYFIEAVLFFILVFNYFKTSENRSKVFNSLFISAFLVSVYAIYQKITGDYWSGGVGELRVTSVFPYPNALGLYLGPIIVLLYFYILEQIQRFKDSKIQRFGAIFYFFIFILSLAAIYFARSEAALAAVAMSIFFGSLFVSKRFAVSFVILGFIGGGIIFVNDGLRTFALEKVQLKDFSGEVRKQQWRETQQALRSDYNFIAGCGLSGYQACVEPYHQEGIFFSWERDPDFRRKIVIFDDKYRAEHWRPVEIYMYPHNFFLNFWVELGLLGVISVIGLISQFFYFGFKLVHSSTRQLADKNSSNKNNRIIIIGLMAVMIEIILHGTLDVPYFKNDLSFLWWLLFALMGVYWAEYGPVNKKMKYSET